MDRETFTGAAATASLAYFRATGHDVPSHVRSNDLHAFLANEATRWAKQTGTSARICHAADTLLASLEA
jgi:hypothetical protein